MPVHLEYPVSGISTNPHPTGNPGLKLAPAFCRDTVDQHGTPHPLLRLLALPACWVAQLHSTTLPCIRPAHPPAEPVSNCHMRAM